MPPMQISALPPSTAARVANLKSSSQSSLTSSTGSVKAAAGGSSRATGQTVSSMQKQSDTSLRRHQLPTIAGSPSVASVTGAQPAARDSSQGPPIAALNTSGTLSKETPTKIPRISSRTSATHSPTLKPNGNSRRASMVVGTSGLASSRGGSPANGNESMNEFGVLEGGQVSASKTARTSVRASPQTSSSRVPRQVSAPAANGTTIPRKNRESLSFAGLRKSSTSSVASTASAATHDTPQASHSHSHHRFSALSPSKGLKLLSPKVSLPTARSSNANSTSTQSIQQAMASPSASRQSLSTPSPAPSSMDDEELLGDEEMMQYIKRQQAKKLQSGSTQEDLDAMLRFPEPIPPVPPKSPHGTFI